MPLAVVSHLIWMHLKVALQSPHTPSSTSARQERELFEHADKGSFSEAPSILGVQVGMGGEGGVSCRS